MGVAALVDGWKRRYGTFAGPTPGGVGPEVLFPDVPLATLVEVLVDGSWQSITHDVFGGDRADIMITRGQTAEGSGVQPARCQFQLNNRDGRYSPRNPISPLYGKIGRNTRCRVRLGLDHRFHGEIPAWPQHWDTTGTDVWVDIEAAGILRRLSKGTLSKPLQSSLTRLINAPFNADNVLVDWPLEDESDATTAASVTPGASPMVNVTGLRFAVDNDGLPGSKPLAQIPANVFTHYEGKVPDYTPSSPESWSVQLYFHIETAATAPAYTYLMVVGATGTAARWDLYIDDGNLHIGASTSTGTPVVSTTSGGTHPTWFGAFTLLRLDLVQNGGNVDWDVWVIPVDTGAAFHYQGSYAGTVGTITDVNNEALSPVAATIGHIVVSIGTTLNWLAPADIGYRGETAANRFRRLCIEQGIPQAVNGDRTDSELMGPQTPIPLLELLRQCEATDGGIMYETRNSFALAYRTRKDLYAQPSFVDIDYTSGALGSVPFPVDDDQFAVNDVTVSRIGGSKKRLVQTTGPLSISDPPAGVGTYDQDYPLSLYRDDQLEQQAAWRRHLGTIDEPRFPTVHVNLANRAVADDPDLPRLVSRVTLGDRFTINNPPAWLPPEQIQLLAIGSTERLHNLKHDIRWVCRPASAYDAGIVGDAGFKIASDGSTLTADVTDVATSWSVASTSNTPLWTTDAAEMPFDLMVAGEQVTVTAISGGSSPQTFTVTRSVNGVVKAHTAGTAVQVFRPFRALL